MAIIRAQVMLNKSSGIPADTCINTWHFDVPTTAAASLDAIASAFGTFYSALNSLWSPQLALTGHRWKVYDLADAEPRAPIRDETIGLGIAVGANALPDECAVCLTYQAPRSSGTNQQSRRGRLFLGPFSDALTGSGTNANRPASAPISQIATAATNFLGASDSSSLWTWVVYSRKLGLAFNVTDGWVDNAMDIQRRRGVLPSARTLWT